MPGARMKSESRKQEVGLGHVWQGSLSVRWSLPPLHSREP